MTKDLYLDGPKNGSIPFCPRCGSQINVHEEKFTCDCGFDDEAWQAAMQAADEEFNR